MVVNGDLYNWSYLMMSADKWDFAHMECAKVYAELSHAKRLKVGCVIVRDKRIISIGYNGMPAGWDNECEFERDGELYTKPEVLHAETNALAKVASSNESCRGAELYCTHSPCLDCAKLIYQAGIVKVFFGEEYKSRDGIEFLLRSGVEVSRLV